MIRRGSRVVRAAAALVAIFLHAPLSGADFAGKRVVQIRFEPPVQPVPTSELKSQLPLQEGDTFTTPAIRRSIESLFRTGRYEDISVDAAETDNEVTLTFITVNRWFIGAQTITGTQEPPSDTQLLNSTKLSLGQEFTESGLRQATENMIRLLNANGFYEASVNTDIQRDPHTDQVDIHYAINTGKRVRFTDPVIRGHTTLSVSDIIRSTGWKRFLNRGGYRPVTEARVQSGMQGIRRKMENRGLLLSRVNLAGMEWKQEQNVAVPTIEINDGSRIDLQIDGFRISRGTQRKLIPVFEEHSVDMDLLNEGSRNIASYLQSRGYFDAKVGFTTRSTEDAEEIHYTIDRGQRYTLANLEITGNQYFKQDALRERMSIIPATPIRYRHGRFSNQMLQADIASIENLYHSNGFLNVAVKPALSTGFRDKEQLQSVSLHIEEGHQFLIGDVRILGVEPETESYVRSIMQSAPGQPFSDETIALDRETVLNLFFNYGYTNATLEWTTERNPNNLSIDIEITINTGKQVFVRQVLVGGLQNTVPRLVYDRISLKPGDPLSLGEMLESQRRLYDLGVFARVDAALQNPDGEESAKYVLFEVEEAKKYSYNIGVGAQVGRIGRGSLQSFDSPAGATGFSPRLNAGITRNNFLGLGHSITLQGRISNIQQRAQTTYIAPHFRNRDDLSLSFSALYDDSRDVRTFAAKRLEAAAQITRRLSRANTWQGRYILRKVTVDPNSLKIEPQLIPRLAQPVRLGIVASSFIQDRRDNPIESTRGFYNSVDVGMAIRQIGSQSNFARVLARNSSYYRLTHDVVFARSITFGFQDRLDGGPLSDVPLPERFFAGGASTHRGFPENQAGPRDLITGFPIGGKSMMIFNHEIRHPLIGDSLGAVLFHDMGNVYSRIGKMGFRVTQRDIQDFDYMVQAVGIGFRYRTPIGPIRIDLAYVPNSPRFLGFEGTRDELLFGQGRQSVQRINQFQFHFSLGQAF